MTRLHPSRHPKTAPLVPVSVEIKHGQSVSDVRTEQGIRPYASPLVTSVTFRGWERASGQIIQYEGTLTNASLRQEPPTEDDLGWLRAIGALDAPPPKRFARWRR